nr:glutaminase [Candidatus Krumholzibacteria bacterium]
MPDYSAVLQEIEQIIQPSLSEGQVASYIPELGAVPLGGFAMALIDAQGQVHQCGTAHAPFSIQSISKLFTLTLVLREMGPSLWDKVGREPSGSSFNSLLHLEYEDGRPRNPFINAGALVVTDLL